tara:strand:+ start:4237 stop:4434 length:198 start_codon:yes stop_codon:yes gene_type:complete
MSPAQVPITGFDLLKFLIGSLNLNESIRSEIVVDSPPGIIRPSIPSRSDGSLTDEELIPILERIR